MGAWGLTTMERCPMTHGATSHIAARACSLPGSVVVPPASTLFAIDGGRRLNVARCAVRKVLRSRQDYLAERLAHRYGPGHVATLPPAEGIAQPPLDDRFRRAGAGFLNLPWPRWSWRADTGFVNLPLPRWSRRADVGFRDVPLVLKGTTPCCQNPRVFGSSSSTVAQSHRSSTRRPCGS
ncbi:hypothetical protein HPB52_023923 [Rhipicephalus sanguineus]|uniref:Uncharacterized protein n=1 Tax=Rhipicephalus sanguineus TaxID=34632 RepID=A0A9D4T4Q8_RHISA|nr:hypothetical protein HPB52_023923 [Rhipicephalus sanguineus]